MLIAVFMVVPCAAAMDATAVVAEDDSTGLEVGDAWGISYSMTKDELIELLLDDGGPGLEVPGLEVPGLEVPGLEVPGLEDEMNTLLNEAITNAELDASFIVEVTRANASGYTISIDGGIRLKLSAEYSENINFLTLIELPFNIDGNVDAIILMNGLVNLDTNYMITSANLNLDLLIDADVTTNLSMMKFIEYMEYLEDPGSEVVFLKDIFTETDNTSKLKIGASASFIMYSTEESGVTPIYDEENLLTSYIIDLESKQSINASVFVNISGELVEAIKYLDEEGDFEKYIVKDAIQASFAIFETESEEFDFEIDVIKISDNDDETSKYEFYFEDLYLGTGDFLPAEVPNLGTLADLDVNRDAKYYLNGAKKTDVRNNINSIRGSYNDSVSSLIFTVTYTVDEKDTTQEVSYNGLINPPKVEDIVEGKKFIGWYNEDGDEWNPHWGVKSDLMLSPMYAKNHTTVDELFLHMASNTHGYMKIDGATNLMAFESADFKFDGTMIVDVYDGNKFLYSWKITNNGTLDSDKTTMKLNIDKGNLTDDQRKKLSDNRQSDEGNFIYINFGASGQMPGRTTVTYNVSDTFENGTALQIYYAITDVDGEIIGFEPVREVSVVDGNVVFDIDHCSGYVLSEMIVSDSGDDNTLLYVGMAAAAIILIIVAAVFVMRSRSRSA